MRDVTRIAMVDLRPEIEELWDELSEAFQRVLRAGQFILGPEVEAFEQEVADYLGVRHAVGVNSGTDALVVGLRAQGIGSGDEVITTSFTFFATAEAIGTVGAAPIFVDIDPRTFNLDPLGIEGAISERTKAILPVHLYGHPSEMDPIMEIARRHDLTVLEDCAQAMGASYRGRKVGAIGDVAALSFFPSKNLGGFGDGGMLVTDDDEVADLARMLRSHGSKRKYENEMLGYNTRLDELQASLLRVKLRHLDRMNEARRNTAARYDEAFGSLANIVTPHVAPSVDHVYHQYTIRVLRDRRDHVSKVLGEHGVSTKVYYPVPIHLMKVFPHAPQLPHSVRASHEVLSLPMTTHLVDPLIDAVVASA